MSVAGSLPVLRALVGMLPGDLASLSLAVNPTGTSEKQGEKQDPELLLGGLPVLLPFLSSLSAHLSMLVFEPLAPAGSDGGVSGPALAALTAEADAAELRALRSRCLMCISQLSTTPLNATAAEPAAGAPASAAKPQKVRLAVPFASPHIILSAIAQASSELRMLQQMHPAAGKDALEDLLIVKTKAQQFFASVSMTMRSASRWLIPPLSLRSRSRVVLLCRVRRAMCKRRGGELASCSPMHSNPTKSQKPRHPPLPLRLSVQRPRPIPLPRLLRLPPLPRTPSEPRAQLLQP